MTSDIENNPMKWAMWPSLTCSQGGDVDMPIFEPDQWDSVIIDFQRLGIDVSAMEHSEVKELVAASRKLAKLFDDVAESDTPDIVAGELSRHAHSMK